ncbi:hypothetical protein MBLNU230_g4612t1 [Neophaeotheca triangularis]
MLGQWLLPIALLATRATASYYDEGEIGYNLNTNQQAVGPLEYDFEWEGKSNDDYFPSPDNWRIPFYSFFLDRFVNGDPTNDNTNETAFEHDLKGTQLRHGGDIKGLADSLDYLHGLGIRGLYIVGSPFINEPWEYHAFHPHDHTILDHHFGDLQEWRNVIQRCHDLGMYVVLENTMATMTNLIGFADYLNSSTPFSFHEHDTVYKEKLVHYRDFESSNEWQEECDVPYPTFWDQGGHVINDENTTQMVGCMNSDFNQYGDAGAFGVYPEWQKQLSDFDGVQNRLRDWKPSVLKKLEHFGCMWIKALDVDGFRIDKAMQVTEVGQSNYSHAMRECAKEVGKNNFFIPGEIVNGNANGAIYLGRGMTPEMSFHNTTLAATSKNGKYIRDLDHAALDGGAFHYSTYRGLMRFLGLDGNLLAAQDTPVNFIDAWNIMMNTNDMANANTGEFDPRHMYGVSNQDVLKWPGLINGTERQILGDYIITLLMPGIPLISWGEEQAFYTLDSTAANYIYGRQAMSSSEAWQMHGCYVVPNNNLNNWPVNSSALACEDDTVALDHRDPSHPLYGALKQMFDMRTRYPALNDGWTLLQLSNQTFNYTLPGSFGVPTETGLYSAIRGPMEGVQDLSDQGEFGNQPVWLLYTNYNGSKTYECDCKDNDEAIISPFEANTTVKNLFYPFDEWDTEESGVKKSLYGSDEFNGCLPEINMTMYGFKAFVPKANWTAPLPIVTKFLPGHDHRIMSNSSADEASSVDFEIRFSYEMSCDSVTANLGVNSTTESGTSAKIFENSIDCGMMDEPEMEAHYYGPSPSVWRLRATLNDVYDGIHQINVHNVSSEDGDRYTNSNDHFLLRIGQIDNPIIFPKFANYSDSLLFKTSDSKRDVTHGVEDDQYFINHKAAGADKWRYTMTWGAVWSDWMDYEGGNSTLEGMEWSGPDHQDWDGEHVQVQYWSELAGSSDHLIEGDLAGSGDAPRRYPHFFIHGSFNEYGFDAGLENKMKQLDNGSWIFDFMWEWPTQFQLSVWGMTENGQPDKGWAFGDVDNDTVLDRISPHSLTPAVVNITNHGPPSPGLSWRILFDDRTMRYYLVPNGNRYLQLVMWILMLLVPITTALTGVWLYMHFFYGVKFNQIGLSEEKHFLPTAVRRAFHRNDEKDPIETEPEMAQAGVLARTGSGSGSVIREPGITAGATVEGQRRTVLIGTMEYDISDWNIKIKIGGLGVMAQLMGKNLEHQDLIWVVPCAGGIDYPMDTPGLPIDVTILGRTYEVQVQYHKLNNITYMLLDAPVFRRQTAKEPYPARMDDLDSAIYYSAWNQCIAEAMRRFPIDLYHINDYHGTIAPLYLLPDTIPCCLSLHNAEFQGLWPMRNPQETEEICSVFNLSPAVVSRYIQFGEIFNLLHAGASILRIHQKGFGAVGVSKKYGKRSWARYPIFWGLRKIGALPNPDPSDVSDWDKKLADPDSIHIDESFESGRADLKRQAQEWAGLDQRPDADLFVFVGRWSMQKGIDLIADVFPAILEQYEHTQLICVGPQIDMYGKFAALKLDRMMEKYPGRVYSKPEFTALPPFIFSGAEFALIPSRDEPFGLVAVEFGRKGALGVGSRVGGLGQMPGWWFTVESQTTKHMLHQFKMAIAGALKADYQTRATMRARSGKQRFPVAQWKEDLEILQATSIKIHKKRMERMQNKRLGIDTGSAATSGWNTPNLPGWMTPRSGWATPTGASTPRGGATTPTTQSRPNTRPSSPSRSGQTTPAMSRNGSLSLGMRHGPGHSPPQHAQGSLSSRSHSSDEDNGGVPRRRLSSIEDEEQISTDTAEDAKRQSRMGGYANQDRFEFELRDGTVPEEPAPRDRNSYFSPAQTPGITPSGLETPGASYPFLAQSGNPGTPGGYLNAPHTPGGSGAMTPLSQDHVMNEKADKKPQDLMPFFNDPTGLYYKTFDKQLDDLNGKNSESKLCIEEYLEKSEKQWFNRLHQAKMTKNVSTPGQQSMVATPAGSIYEGIETEEPLSQFLLPDNYQAPTGLKRVLSTKIRDWPIYAFLLALGQIIAANSYQITLLTGQNGQTATQLYVIASVYLATSLIWWYLFRRLACLYVVSAPWFFYGFSFFLLGFAPYTSEGGRGGLNMAATVMYAIASSSGSIFFSQNFGSLGSVPVRVWAFRACAIQGTQQIYIVALWYWGSTITANVVDGGDQSTLITYRWPITAIVVPIAVLLWSIGIVLFLGLPDFYRQKPGAVPSFYSSILRRKIVLWFFFAVFIQNIFLSAPYGRNWRYLFSSQHAPTYAVWLLIILFFVIIWAAMLWYFGRLSHTHSWILPMFAVGLGAPRWCQILWSTSSIGQYLPWAGGPVASAVLGRCLWLWLGVLDSMQGVGFGMILLQTLTRFHITFVLITAQVVGSIATIIARADGLNSIGPGPTFPSFASGLSEPLSEPWFWVALILQLVICAGFFTFFRKEQLSKP